MTHPLVAALEGKFQKVRNIQWPLNRRLEAIADEIRVFWTTPHFGIHDETL